VQHISRTIDISCLPSDIPDEIEVDITALNVGESIHVSSLELENVNLLTEAERTIVTVVAPTVIKSAAEEAPEEGEEVAEGEEAAEGEAKPEGEGKAEGEGEAKAETEGKAEGKGKGKGKGDKK
jgi:large subunit ribosomal protein L25